MPILLAVALPLAAYLVRSIVIRNGDFGLDVPDDLIALTVLVAGIGLVASMRRGRPKT